MNKDEKRQAVLISVIWIIMGILIGYLIFLSYASAATIINPGQSTSIDCNGTDNNYTISCGLCTGNTTCPVCPETNTTPEDCGVCSIDRELEPGEFYEKQEGVCDLEIVCGEGYGPTKKTERNFMMYMNINKLEGDELHLDMEVRDFLGTVIENKNYDFDRNDVVTAKYRYNFTCPAEILIDTVDFESCNQYFDRYFEDTNPVAMQLAQGNRDCMNNLVECQAGVEADKSVARDFKDQYEDCMTWKGVADQKALELNSSLMSARADITGEFRRLYDGHVPGYWMVIAGVEFVVILLGVGAFVFGPRDIA